MNRGLIVFWLSVSCLTPSFAAQKSSPKKTAPPPGDRYLFVVETSSSMRNLEHAGRQAVFDLIYSGVDGRMRAGDTYGLWIFNDQTHAGVFPMQTWKPEEALNQASRAGLFLKGQRYENGADVASTVKKVVALVKSVGDVTIFIISDGNSAFEGTAFDRPINATYAERDGDRHRAKQPFVTTLVARGGELIAGTVTVAGEALALPERPEPAQIAQTPAKDLFSVQSQPASATNRVIHIVSSSRGTAENQETATALHEDRRTFPEGASLNSTPTQSRNETTPTPTTTSETTQSLAASGPNNTLPAENHKTNSSLAAGITNSLAGQPAVIPAPTVNNPLKTDVAQPPASGPTPLPAMVPAPLTAAAREISGTTSNAVAEPAVSSSLTGLATPTDPMISPRGMLITGLGLLAVALVLIVLFLWRSRPAPQPSFISRSMEHR